MIAMWKLKIARESLALRMEDVMTEPGSKCLIIYDLPKNVRTKNHVVKLWSWRTSMIAAGQDARMTPEEIDQFCYLMWEQSEQAEG